MSKICEYYKDESTFFSTKNKCLLSGEAKDITNDYYNYYCKNDGYKCPLYEKHFGSTTTGCFITTITCEILKKEDNDLIMERLRLFRDKVLQENEKYYDVLKEYDVIGPIIVNHLRNDDKKENISKTLYEYILTPIASLTQEGKYDEAVEKYSCMTLFLINYYGLIKEYIVAKNNNYNYETFNPKSSGHGRILNKKDI